MDNALYNKRNWASYTRLTWCALLLTLFVILLGAYTRLDDAGLGCPDWPACYGKLIVPSSSAAITQAQQAFPNTPLVTNKAWIEMIHRYFAGGLGLIIGVLALWALCRRAHDAKQPLLVPWLLVALVIMQALLGMWTVTLKLLPIIVLAHLFGGLAIAALLWWLVLSTRKQEVYLHYEMAKLRFWSVLALIILLLQLFLGAWTSTNYAALACPSFPFCQGSLFPAMDWQAFNLFTPIGPNYEGGHLAMDARVTIQMAHRYGAALLTAYFIPLSLILIKKPMFKILRPLGWLLLLLLILQFALGIINIEWLLPLWSALLHTGIATLLLLTVVTLIHRSFAAAKRKVLL